MSGTTTSEPKSAPGGARFRARLRTLLALLARTPAPLRPAADVAFLRKSRALSGYRNVYQSGPGWVAKVKEGGRLFLVPGSRQPTPQQSAAFVVAYYRERYGPRWKRALRNRKRIVWRVRPAPARGGWLVSVWVDGKLREWATRTGGSTPLVFAAKVDATRFVKRWARDYLTRPVWRSA